jgi:hypothetical protein
MLDHPPLLNWRRHLLAAAGFALLLLGVCYTLATHDVANAHTEGLQGTLSMAITKTLEGSPVVRVGQYLTFTIRITNTGTITIVKLPLFDEYEPNILRFDQANPAPSTISSGRITWTNLPTDVLAGPLPPGGAFSVATRFQVIGITDQTINRAFIQDAIGEGGQSGGSGSGQGSGTTRGGQVILEKMLAPGLTPLSGLPITFTISIRNDGAADLVRVPVQDMFSTEYLLFRTAFPTPTLVVPGELRWDDVLPGLGLTRLRPNEIVTITAVFTAVKSVDAAVLNSAGAAGVRDEFQNELAAPRRAEVPIRILPGPGEALPTASPQPRPRPQPQPESTPTAELPTTAALTPTMELTATAAAPAETATPTVAPARLPRTGDVRGEGWLLALAALILSAALALRYRRDTTE